MGSAGYYCSVIGIIILVVSIVLGTGTTQLPRYLGLSGCRQYQEEFQEHHLRTPTECRSQGGVCCHGCLPWDRVPIRAEIIRPHEGYHYCVLSFPLYCHPITALDGRRPILSTAH